MLCLTISIIKQHFEIAWWRWGLLGFSVIKLQFFPPLWLIIIWRKILWDYETFCFSSNFLKFCVLGWLLGHLYMLALTVLALDSQSFFNLNPLSAWVSNCISISLSLNSSYLLTAFHPAPGIDLHPFMTSSLLEPSGHLFLFPHSSLVATSLFNSHILQTLQIISLTIFLEITKPWAWTTSTSFLCILQTSPPPPSSSPPHQFQTEESWPFWSQLWLWKQPGKTERTQSME